MKYGMTILDCSLYLRECAGCVNRWKCEEVLKKMIGREHTRRKFLDDEKEKK